MANQKPHNDDANAARKILHSEQRLISHWPQRASGAKDIEENETHGSRTFSRATNARTILEA